MRTLGVLVLAAAFLVTGCVTPAGSTGPLASADAERATLVDPLAPGPLAVAFADYDAGTVTVGGKDAAHEAYEYDGRVRGRVWYPDAEGAWPLLVFLHGQHGTCAMGDEEAWIAVDSCSDEEGVNTPYPNHLGYAYLAEHLASHGYVVASALGHEVNRQNGDGDVGMWARGELVLATLDAFRDGAIEAPADVSRVGLMGHSRGGEGVVTAVHVNLARAPEDRHALAGVVALAPTDFNGLGVPDVPLLSLVPYCDGDVWPLHGLRTFDHSRHLDDATPKVQVLVRGTNHNYYNTRWYDDTGLPVRGGDDAFFTPTPACLRERDAGGWRWTPSETHAESLVHVAGFLRWQVGDERGLAPWFTGERALPDAACPSGGAPCDDLLAVTAVLPGAERVLVVEDAVPDAHALGGAVEYAGFDRVDTCDADTCPDTLMSSAPVLDLEWGTPGTLTLRFPGGVDWSAFDALAFRVAVLGWENPVLEGVDVLVRVTDADGGTAEARATEHSSALRRAPDPALPTPVPWGWGRIALNAVRVPLDAFDVDATRVTEVALTFEGDGGRALVTDVLVQAEPDVA